VLDIKMLTNPKIAMYFGVVLLFIKTPQNIMMTPQIADNIIAFIFI
jgi:hypothetical protein